MNTMQKIETFEGKIENSDANIMILVSRFNSLITEPLVDGAIDCLLRHNINQDQINLVRVPGAWELPFMAKQMAKKRKWDGIIALGAVIRGDTPHFEYISAEVSKGLATVSLENDIPISFGVLTTNTIDQALNRAGIKSGNKGWEAAQSLLEIISLQQCVVNL